MRIEEYQQLALKTLSSNFFVNKPMPPLLHAAMGFVTETTELLEAFSNGIDVDKVNVCEELGDILWYVAIYCEYSDTDIRYMRYEAEKISGFLEAQQNVLSAIIAAGKFQDIFKKAIYYNNPLDFQKLQVILQDLIYACANIAGWCGKDILTVAATNIQKLQARFPGKFTEDGANNRDLGKEREVLEGAEEAKNIA